MFIVFRSGMCFYFCHSLVFVQFLYNDIAMIYKLIHKKGYYTLIFFLLTDSTLFLDGFISYTTGHCRHWPHTRMLATDFILAFLNFTQNAQLLCWDWNFFTYQMTEVRIVLNQIFAGGSFQSHVYLKVVYTHYISDKCLEIF